MRCKVRHSSTILDCPKLISGVSGNSIPAGVTITDPGSRFRATADTGAVSPGMRLPGMQSIAEEADASTTKEPPKTACIRG
jgi:hypothetical protein